MNIALAVGELLDGGADGLARSETSTSSSVLGLAGVHEAAEVGVAVVADRLVEAA